MHMRPIEAKENSLLHCMEKAFLWVVHQEGKVGSEREKSKWDK